MHEITEEYMMVATSNRDLSRIMFSYTTSHEYNVVAVEDNAMLYVINRLTNTNDFCR